MAVIRNEELQVTVTVNGNDAQKKLMELEANHLKLVQQGKELRKIQAQLIIDKQKESRAFKDVTKAIKEHGLKIKQSQREMDTLRSTMDLSQLSMTQLTNRARILEGALINTTKGSPERKKMEAEYKAIEKQLMKLEFRSGKISTKLDRIADKMNRYQTMMFVATGFIVGLFKVTDKFTSKASELADAISMVEKTTELTNAEVIELIGNFKNIDTRTSRIELLKLSEQAGRLGKRGKKDILEFTKQADYIKVALGDDLKGNTEEHIRLIGKLTDLYAVGASQGLSFSQGMQMIGSGINEVSNSGTAQADFLVDYLKRLSGVSLQTNITAQDQLGFAAVLDESGKSVEVSGTAMSKVILNMFKDTKTYSKIAGVGVHEFSKLLKTDTNEALLLFLEGLNGNNEGLGTMTKKLDGLGLDGARAIGVLTALAGQTDKIRTKQDLANKSLNEGSSIIEEFNKKNQNFAAVVDKIKKKFFAFVFDNKLVEGVKHWTIIFGQLVGVSKRTEGVKLWIERLTFLVKLLSVATVGVLSYKSAVALAELWTKRAAAATWLHTVAIKASDLALRAQFAGIALYNSTIFLLTGRTKAAAASFRLFTAALNTNPFILIATVIATVTAALYAFRTEQEELNTQQKIQQKLQESLSDSYIKQKAELETLYKRVKDVNIAHEDRIKALNRIKEIAPGYLSDLTLENSNYIEMKNNLDKYLESKQREIKLKTLDKRSEDIESELYDLDKEQKSIDDGNIELTTTQKIIGTLTFGTSYYKSGLGKQRSEEIKTAKSNLEAEKKEIAELQKQILGEGKDDENSLRVGETKMIGGKQYKWNGTKWIPIKTDDPIPTSNSDSEDPEESDEAKAKKRLAEWLDKWEEDREIQEELKKFNKAERAEQEEILRLENQFAKLEADAYEEKELLSRLEDEKESRLQDIRDKHAGIREKQDKKHKKALLDAEMNLLDAKRSAVYFGISALRDLAKEGSIIYKALFLGEKIFAASDVILAGMRERAAYMANPTWSAMPDGGAAIKAKHVLASKIRTGVSLAQIAATTIKGFEDGLYPVRRQQDGKVFNARMGGEMNKTQIVKEPKILVGENMPELIVSGKHFKHLEMNYPKVVNTIMQTAPGYDEGKYPEEDFSEGISNTELLEVIKKLSNKLDNPLKTDFNYRVLEENQARKRKIEQKYNS